MTRSDTAPDRLSDFVDQTLTAGSRGIASPLVALPVLGAEALIERTDLGRLVPLLRIKLGFPREVFALAAWPLIDGFADFVQLLPVAGSRRYGDLGGQLYRGLATVLRALDQRRGQILPRGAAPEIIGEHAHRWTYAVFAAALLRDVTKVWVGLRVWLKRGDHSLWPWDPAGGTMSACGATHYCIEMLPAQNQACACDPALATMLFERCVPDAIRAWLGEDARLMPELLAELSASSDPASAIGELVERAATGSRSDAKLPTPVREEPAPNPAPVISNDGLKAVDFGTAEPETLEGVRQEGSELARRFMHWLQRGIAGGTLLVNVPGALVHGVNEGLLLASPRIFRRFAKHDGFVDATAAFNPEQAVEPAKRIQREVLRAGWHLRADHGVNILSYQWLRDHRAMSRINGIVICEPGRFVAPPPPINPALVRVVDAAGIAD